MTTRPLQLPRLPRLPGAWRERTDWVTVDTPLGKLLRGLRWAAIATYVVVAGYHAYRDGLPLDREGLLLWLAVGLACACIGRHPVWMLWLAVDFLPFALVLILYDYLRAISDTVGLPTWWKPQIDVDKFLFAGHVPTVWLQEHLKHQRFSGVRWYDMIVGLTYGSFFIQPYLTAAVMWLRSRVDFYRWSLRWIALSFFSFLLFTLIPAAPPWAAARCTAADVASHPNNPPCLNDAGAAVHGGLLGAFTTHQPGGNPWVERIAFDGFFGLHLGIAHRLWMNGSHFVDAVAAVPSLHVGGTVLFALFMWRRLSKWWRPFLVAYPLMMQFSLTYSGEHYVADGIAGALCAWLIHWLATRIERHRAICRESPPDRLESPPATPRERVGPV